MGREQGSTNAIQERYELAELEAFRKFFPDEMFFLYQAHPTRLVGVFETLSKYGFEVKADKEARDFVLGQISVGRFGPSLHVVFRNGIPKIYSSNAQTLVRAGVDLWATSFPHLTGESKTALDKLFHSS